MCLDHQMSRKQHLLDNFPYHNILWTVCARFVSNYMLFTSNNILWTGVNCAFHVSFFVALLIPMEQQSSHFSPFPSLRLSIASPLKVLTNHIFYHGSKSLHMICEMDDSIYAFDNDSVSQDWNSTMKQIQLFLSSSKIIWVSYSIFY